MPRQNNIPGIDSQIEDTIGIIPPTAYDFAVEVVRPQDLLILRFEFINFDLQLDEDNGPNLVRLHPDMPAYMIIHFPPQSIVEEAFLERLENFPITDPQDPDDDKDDQPLSDPPVRSRLSGPSRLVFNVPDEITEIPYTLTSLLDWSQYEQSVHPTAQKPLPSSALLNPQFRASLVPFTDILAAFSDTLQAPDQPERRSSSSILSPTEPALALGLLNQDVAQQFINWAKGQVGINPSLIQILNIKPVISEPALHQTAIEAPYRLIVSPHRAAAWAHAAHAVTRNGRTELWHTRLAVRNEEDQDNPIDEQDDALRTLRAIWSPDYPLHLNKIGSQEGALFRMSLSDKDRYELVRLMSDYYAQQKGSLYIPQPASAKRFMLTALGAWMNVHGNWRPPCVEVNYQPECEPLTIQEWRHRATMGRDHYVRVVKEGYLWPFGHRASLVKITERKFEPPPVSTGQVILGRRVAYLRQRMYIVVREPEKQYPIPGQKSDGRRMPFKRVRLTTLETPDLDAPADSKILDGDIPDTSAFWPQVSSDDFLFQLVAEDEEGQQIEFTAPLAFLGADIAQNTDSLKEIVEAYEKDEETRRKRAIQGQKVAFARNSNSGDTTLETVSITFCAETLEDTSTSDQPLFVPTFAKAEVRIPAVQQLLGDDQPVEIDWHETYLRHGLDGPDNQGEVFVKLSNSKALNLPVDKAGGVATPNIGVSGLSRSLGPVGGDLTRLDTGEFDPQEFFGGADAKLLGSLSLQDILGSASLGETPKLTNWFDETENCLKTQLYWETESFQDFPPFVHGDNTKLTIDALLCTSLDPSGETDFRISGKLEDFEMNLFGMVAVTFGSFAFTAQSGQKVSANPDIQGVEFGGPLEFVKELQTYLSPPVSGSGPFLDVTPAGLKAGYTLAIPAVEIGVFSLTDIRFTAAMHLPFTGQAMRLRFDFADRHNPILLSVYMFGGTAYLGLAIGLDGVELLEAALEFGGNLSFDIGVASGGVFVMAGIYFKWEVMDTGHEKVELAGYLRLGGELSVLGLITISVEFYMGLTYNFGTKKVIGRATLTVKVEVLLFSTKVELSVERRFAGSGADPLFIEMMPLQENWDTYCDAFAAYPL